MSMRPPITLPLLMPRNAQPLAQPVEGDAAATDDQPAQPLAQPVWVNGKGRGKQDDDEDGMGKGKFQKGDDGKGKAKFQKGEDGKGKGKFQKGKDKNGIPFKARPTRHPHIYLGDEAGHATTAANIELPIAGFAKNGKGNGARSWVAFPPSRSRSPPGSPQGSPDAA
jgi:hypothetical protein